MSNFFDDILKSDASYMANASYMPGVETVLYTESGKDERAISAQVFRPQKQDGDMGVTLGLRIVVSRTDLASVTESMDRVRLPKQIGDTDSVSFRVVEIISQDPGAFELRLE